MRDREPAGEGSSGKTSGAEDEKAERRSSRAAIVLTDREGRFALRGLEPGRLAVMARQQEHASEWVHVEVAEGQEPDDIVLHLRKNARAHGLVSLGATPVAGARIVALPSGGAYRPAYIFAQSDAGLLLKCLAPGHWAICLEQHPSACSAGEILAGAELTLEKPAPPSKENP